MITTEYLFVVIAESSLVLLCSWQSVFYTSEYNRRRLSRFMLNAQTWFNKSHHWI